MEIIYAIVKNNILDSIGRCKEKSENCPLCRVTAIKFSCVVFPDFFLDLSMYIKNFFKILQILFYNLKYYILKREYL